MFQNFAAYHIRRNDTLKRDGNTFVQVILFFTTIIIRRNDTLKGDGNHFTKNSG